MTTYSVDWDAEGLTQHFARQWWDSGITLAQRPGRHKAPEWMRHKGRPRFQYLEESKQVIRMGVLKAEKTYDPELGKQSTHAGYAVVDELEKWVADQRAFEVPIPEYHGKARRPEEPSRGSKVVAKRLEADKDDDEAEHPEEPHASEITREAGQTGLGTFSGHTGVNEPLEGLGQSEVPLPEADGPQTRSSPSAELEDEALPSASGSAPQSSQVTRAGSRLHGQAEPADPILMSYSPPSRGGHCLPLGASETQAVAFLLRMETPSLEVCKRAAALLERQEQQLMEARRTIKRTDEDLQLEVTRYIRRNARRFGPQAIKVADAVRKDIQRDRKNPQRKKQRRRKERGNSAQGF